MNFLEDHVSLTAVQFFETNKLRLSDNELSPFISLD